MFLRHVYLKSSFKTKPIFFIWYGPSISLVSVGICVGMVHIDDFSKMSINKLSILIWFYW